MSQTLKDIRKALLEITSIVPRSPNHEAIIEIAKFILLVCEQMTSQQAQIDDLYSKLTALSAQPHPKPRA
jgi:hypothetical protein